MANTTQATAAYNFVGLPDKILPAELDTYHERLLSDKESDIHTAFQNFLAEKGNLSGSIHLAIETLTPLFVGGNGEQTFAPAGRVILPGSSLRGMVKNLMKIITCGSWKGDEDLNDRHVYFRCLMAPNRAPNWMKDLHKLYTGRMTSTVRGKAVKNAKTGFLLKDKKGNYFVCPLLPQHKFKRILITEYQNKFGERIGVRDTFVAWHDDEAYTITGSQPPYRLKTKEQYKRLSDNEKKKAGKQLIRYVSLRDADWNPKHWLSVPDEVIHDYEDDTNRRGVDLLNDKGRLPADRARSLGAKLADNIVSVIPCGYLEHNGEISAFGHGLSFRIPYKRSTMDAIPAALKKDTIDFATAIFGNKERWAGRVFFEDAEPLGQIEKLPTKTAHPLLQPNPTSYQLYLQQDGKKLKHWDAPEGVKIRGYKLYWHNKMSDWQATPDEEKLTNVVRKITPIKRGSKFTAKIRFKNLSAVELGALLMVFDMAGSSDKIAYKLGQGKSLGLGSIRIQSQLYVDSQDVYTNLFTDGLLQDAAVASDKQKYLDAFEQYVSSKGMARCWQGIMGELSQMLDWEHAEKTKGWSERVKSMSGNVQKGDVDERFVNRDILPSVREVYGK